MSFDDFLTKYILNPEQRQQYYGSKELGDFIQKETEFSTLEEIFSSKESTINFLKKFRAKFAKKQNIPAVNTILKAVLGGEISVDKGALEQSSLENFLDRLSKSTKKNEQKDKKVIQNIMADDNQLSKVIENVNQILEQSQMMNIPLENYLEEGFSEEARKGLSYLVSGTHTLL